ncbi:MAG: hypothetical protein AAGJ34_12635 [Pseudomonadota bacterium]
MRTTFICLFALSFAWPAVAEDEPFFSFDDLIQEMEQLAEEAAPLMQDWMAWITPQLEALGDRIGDLSQYEAPEVLPNGDIIIRKKLGPPEEGQIDL